MLWISLDRTGFYDKFSYFFLMYSIDVIPLLCNAAAPVTSLSFQEISLQQSWVVALLSSQTTYIYQQQSIIYLFSRTYTVIKRKILKHFGAILGSLKSRCEKPGWNTGLFLLRHGVISWVWLKWLETKAKITRSGPWVGLYSILGSYDQIYDY